MTLGPVRVMGAGMVLVLDVEEVDMCNFSIFDANNSNIPYKNKYWQI